MSSIQYVPYRGHSLKTLEFYGVKQGVSDDGELLDTRYPYPNGGVKIRNLREKSFFWDKERPYTGPGLLGRDRFSSGSSKAVTVTEGEEDMLAAFEMLGGKYPVVSVQSSGSAAKDCAVDKEWLDSFEKIYLCFDNDKPGEKAVHEVSLMFPYAKIYVVKKTKHKDANDYLLNKDIDEYVRLWWNAKRHDPENVISSFADVRSILSKPKKKAICSFPFKALQEMTLGIRTGETYLYKAMEGIGKTELLGAIEYHFAKETELPFGLIHLEEDVGRAASRFACYEVREPVHLDGVTSYSEDQVFDIYTKVVKADNRVHFYQKGKNDTDTDAFLAAIRFMVASAGCKAVFFDHITRLATSFRLEDERKELDYVSTKLSEMAEELDFSLHMISHVNDEGATRGSRNISKEAWTVINLNRDKMNPDPVERNKTYISIEKNRHASFTGPAGFVYFDPKTFCLSEEPPKVIPPVGETEG